MSNGPTPRPLDERRKSARDESAPAYIQRRNEIMHAARQVFREKGFQAATFKDIAEVCRTDRASVYYYFSHKKELFREIVQEHVVANVRKAEQIASRRDLSAPDKVLEMIADLMGSYERTYPDLFIYIQEDMGHLESEEGEWAEEMRRLSRRYDRILEKVITDGVKSGAFTTDLGARFTAFAIIGMVNWAHRWYRPELGSAREIGERMANLTLQGLVTRRRRR